MQRNPFAVLHLPPDADLEAARSEYRALARRHHPDMATGIDKATATRQMAELNWAIDELERDIERWRVMSGGAPAIATAYRPRQQPVSVTPTLVLLDHENGFCGYVTAAAPGVAGAEIKLRYQSDLIRIERLHLAAAGVANFRVTLAPGVDRLPQAQIERLELRAPGLRPVEVKVSVEPFTAAEAPARPQAAASRLPLAEILAGGAAFVCALGALLFAV